LRQDKDGILIDRRAKKEEESWARIELHKHEKILREKQLRALAAQPPPLSARESASPSPVSEAEPSASARQRQRRLRSSSEESDEREATPKQRRPLKKNKTTATTSTRAAKAGPSKRAQQQAASPVPRPRARPLAGTSRNQPMDFTADAPSGSSSDVDGVPPGGAPRAPTASPPPVASPRTPIHAGEWINDGVITDDEQEKQREQQPEPESSAKAAPQHPASGASLQTPTPRSQHRSIKASNSTAGRAAESSSSQHQVVKKEGGGGVGALKSSRAANEKLFFTDSE
jgi:hypothetical protein